MKLNRIKMITFLITSTVMRGWVVEVKLHITHYWHLNSTKVENEKSIISHIFNIIKY